MWCRDETCWLRGPPPDAAVATANRPVGAGCRRAWKIFSRRLASRRDAFSPLLLQRLTLRTIGVSQKRPLAGVGCCTAHAAFCHHLRTPRRQQHETAPVRAASRRTHAYARPARSAGAPPPGGVDPSPIAVTLRRHAP